MTFNEKWLDNCNAVIFPPDTLICEGCDNQENCIVSDYLSTDTEQSRQGQKTTAKESRYNQECCL